MTTIPLNPGCGRNLEDFTLEVREVFPSNSANCQVVRKPSSILSGQLLQGNMEHSTKSEFPVPFSINMLYLQYNEFSDQKYYYA